MHYIAVAYYTENSIYAEEVKKLEASLKRHKMDYELVAIRDQSSWHENAHFKPYFIKQMLYRHFPKDVLYIDADAIVQQYPYLFDTFKADLGVVYFKRPHHDEELLGGTLYFANNARTMELVDRWIACCLEYHTVWDQKVLQHIIYETKDINIKIERLPPNYCQIFDLMQHVGHAVIEHFQASRKVNKN